MEGIESRTENCGCISICFVVCLLPAVNIKVAVSCCMKKVEIKNKNKINNKMK